MKAVVLEKGALLVSDIPEPQPFSGALLARPLVCGVCGSDLHARDHVDHLCDLLHRAGFRGFMNPDEPVVMGHEFCCEVLEGGTKFARGQRIVALPFLTGPDGVELIGYSNRFNGAFAERMLLDEAASFAVPDHVPTEVAALTEPLAVGVHAVAESGIDADCAAAVYGCGPVGLFVIARLKALGLGPVIAIEPSAARREMAAAMGADMVITPDEARIGGWFDELGLPIGLSDTMARATQTRARQRAVLFDCVGKPGMLMQIARAAPVAATIVVVGNCMEIDPIEPAFLLQKSLQVRFVFAYSPDEFAAALDQVCAAPERLAPMVTGQVPLARAEDAFAALTGEERDVKILVEAV
ncbi:MAG: zinc-binding dehydrogenase [Novosphingobium sp.]|nr:zinc-binding dehydrogenase [Novosphingobium sp.]